jgi:hypothetical protein
VEVNGGQVVDSVKFLLSGYQQYEQGVRLGFHRLQDGFIAYVPVNINQNCVDTFTWQPTKDSNGQYEVWGEDGNGNTTPIRLVDVESWVTGSLSNGKLVTVHYMERNDDTFPGIKGREKADSAKAAITAAWNAEIPYLNGQYPVYGDTFEVALSACDSTRIDWFHVRSGLVNMFDPGKFVLESQYWIGIANVFNLLPSYHYVYSAAAHEMWHACQFKLRNELVIDKIPDGGVRERLEWILEGQADFVPSTIYSWELTRAGLGVPPQRGHLLGAP